MKNVVRSMKLGQPNHLAFVRPARRVDPRNEERAALYAADLRVGVHDSVQKAWRADPAAEEPAEEFVFVTTVTCGEDGGAPAGTASRVLTTARGSPQRR